MHEFRHASVHMLIRCTTAIDRRFRAYNHAVCWKSLAFGGRSDIFVVDTLSQVHESHGGSPSSANGSRPARFSHARHRAA